MKNENFNNYIGNYNWAISRIDVYSINNAIELLNNFDRNKKVYTIGNGGSAALAQHFAQDLLKKCHIPAIFLGNISNVTAFGNDIDFSVIYSAQIENLMNDGDMLICFSSSGNSIDILDACRQTLFCRGKIISFTGFNGGMLKEMSDVNIHVPLDDYGITESIHSLLFHYIIDTLATLDNTENV